MHSTQLACPHCGSTLNFGTSIAAGTSVECLICMQTFAAQPLATESPAAALTPVRSETSPVSVPTAVPAAAAATAVTENSQPRTSALVGKPAQASPAKSSAPRIRRPEKASALGGKGPLLAVAVGLLFLLAGAVGVTFWKINSAARNSAGDNHDPLVALDPNGNTNGQGDNVIPATVNVPANKNGNQPPVEDDEDTRKIKELEKKLLTRKTPAQSGVGEIDFEPTINVKETKVTYVGLSQQKIDLAIGKGVVYLKKNQLPTGTWANHHTVGHASIGGLTLLECQVPPSDLFVQRSAQFVRANIQDLTSTYELSLAILFLDRLGESRDRPLIQGMAMRLLAGQNECGGWSYTCPLLSPQDMHLLFAFLQSNKKPGLLNPLPVEPKNPAAFTMPLPRDPGKLNDPFQKFNDLVLSNPIAGSGPTNPVTPTNPALDPKKPALKPKPSKGMAPIRPEWLTPDLQNLPVVKNQGKGKGQQMSRSGLGDNSNTQFALLAMWAARRHDVPTDQALLAGFQRFTTSQNNDGGWGYAGGGSSSNTMTCVGLLGLAMGHGAAPEIVKVNPNDPKDIVIKPVLQDPKIQNGLKSLARHIGQPMLEGKSKPRPMQNLYFLWSVERVAMLYDLKTIDGKEWYPWGAQILVHHQNSAGDWNNSHYHGANPPLNTCFALLFLKRSNLVQDLTNNLRLYTGIRDSDK